VRKVDAATSQGDEDHPVGRTTEADPRRQSIIASNHERSLPQPPSSVENPRLLADFSGDDPGVPPGGGGEPGRRDPPTISGAVVSPTDQAAWIGHITIDYVNLFRGDKAGIPGCDLRGARH
jgi:hypothetical protein